jgi:hypothetical protein
MRRRAAGLLVLAIALLAGNGSTALAQAPCSSAAHRAFDFWVGDWDVFEFKDGSGPVAHARVELILDGCVLREIYEGTNGLTGQSFSSYDAARGVWHQSWVTNRGQILLLDGGLQQDRMVLTGAQPEPGGKGSLIRGEWLRVGDDVRETATISGDGGKTWRPLFDLLFRARR